MNQMETLLRKAANLFGAMRQPWALVGGLAVSVRTEPRFTRDVDLALSVPDDKTAEAIVHRFCASVLGSWHLSNRTRTIASPRHVCCR